MFVNLSRLADDPHNFSSLQTYEITPSVGNQHKTVTVSTRAKQSSRFRDSSLPKPRGTESILQAKHDLNMRVMTPITRRKYMDQITNKMPEAYTRFFIH
jgi:hypothetical protein